VLALWQALSDRGWTEGGWAHVDSSTSDRPDRLNFPFYPLRSRVSSTHDATRADRSEETPKEAEGPRNPPTRSPRPGHRAREGINGVPSATPPCCLGEIQSLRLERSGDPARASRCAAPNRQRMAGSFKRPRISGASTRRPRCRAPAVRFSVSGRWLPPRPSHMTGAAMTARPATGFASVVTSWKHYRWFHTLAASSAARDSTGRVGLDRPSAWIRTLTRHAGVGRSRGAKRASAADRFQQKTPPGWADVSL
jgi:hypothetical protein